MLFILLNSLLVHGTGYVIEILDVELGKHVSSSVTG